MKNLVKLSSLFLLLAVSCSQQNDVETLEASLVVEEQYLETEAHPNIGEFISPNQAHEKLTRYLEDRELRIQDGRLTGNENYGFIYGLNTIKEFIAKIDEINKTRPSEDQITGIRIYNAINIDESGNPYNDVFLIPVLRDKRDLIDVYKPLENVRAQDATGLILNSSWPCPNMCDPE